MNKTTQKTRLVLIHNRDNNLIEPKLQPVVCHTTSTILVASTGARGQLPLTFEQDCLASWNRLYLVTKDELAQVKSSSNAIEASWYSVGVQNM